VEFKGQGSNTSNTNHVSQPQPQPIRRAAEGNSINMMNNHEGNKKVWVAVIAVIVLIVVGVLGWWGYSKMASPDGIKTDRYQAVFLTNGQVYFGKLANVKSDYVELSDIYYLQVQQSVQPTDTTKTSTENPQVSLAKLGSELHGPEDQMKINRDQVLFWENLKDDSKVVDAIKKNAK
jgi:hypothetical protein